MQALSVRQPWATLICTGLKDVENRTWQTAKAPGRILIHATSAKVPGNWEDVPNEMISNVKNARLFGQIPEYNDMPRGAIIGYVDCYDIVRDSQSIWAQPDNFHWCFRDAHIFYEPIYGVKGVQGHLFDVPGIDENDLPPSYEWICNFPDVQGDTVILPVSDTVMADIESGRGSICYDYTPTMESLFINPDNGEAIKYKTIVFVGKDKTIEKGFDGVEWGPYLLPGDKTVPVPEYNDPNILWSFFEVHFR